MNGKGLSRTATASLAGVLLLLLCFLALGPPTAAGPPPQSPQNVAAGITLTKSAPPVLYQNWPNLLRIPYTLTLQNPQNRTIAARATVTDDLPPGGALESGTTGEDWEATLVPGSTLVTYNSKRPISDALSLVGAYYVLFTPPFRDRTPVVNAAYCFSGTVDGTPRAFCETAPVTTLIRAPDFGLAVGTTGPVCAGGRVTYTLIATNPGGVATSVPFTLTGTVPPALTVDPGTVSDGGLWVSPTLTWTVPTALLASGGNSVTRTFAATVAPGTPDGARLTTTYRFASPEAIPNVPVWEHGLAVVRTTAAFTHTAPVCHGRLVGFYNLSQNATAYHWNFGDGSPVVTETNPTHLYAAPGTYTAILTATGPCGTDVATGTVIVHPLPSPNLLIVPSPTQVGVSTTLWDIGSGGQQWLWDFGDGATAQTLVPSTTHVYTRTGGVVASVTAIAATGCMSTSFRALTVDPGPPCSVTLTAPSMARVGTPVGVQAAVADCFGNGVKNGTVVTFAVSPPGTVAPVTDTTRGGVAQTQVSSTVTGTVTVTGTADSVSGTATIRFFAVGPVYLPLVMRSFPPAPFCAPQRVATLDAGPYPSAVAIDPAGGRAFIAHQQGVRVIDTVHHTVITDVRSVSAGFGIAYDPEHNRIWVATRDATPGRVRVLDGSTYALLATLPAGNGVHSVAYNPNTDRVYVSNFGDGTVRVYDAVNLTALTTLTGFGEPAHIAVNPVTDKIYVADHGTFKGVAVINGATHAWHYIQSTNPALVLLDAYGVAVDATRNRVYATGISQGRIALIDGATDTIVGAMDIHREGGIRVPLRVIAVNPDVGAYGHLFAVTSEEDGGQNQVLLIPVWPMGTPTPVPLDLPSFPLDGIALDPTTDRVWVTSVRDGQVTVVQDGEPLCAGEELPPPSFCAPQWVATVAAGPSPYGVAIDAAGRRAFVAHDQGVRVIDTVNHTVITDVRALTATHGIAYDPDRNRIWVTTRDGGPGHVWVLNGSTYGVLATLPAGGSPHAVAYNPRTGRVYVSNFLSGTVGVYDAAALTLTTVLIGFGEPAHMAVNTVTNKIYVADHGPYRGVVVIDGATHATRTIQAGPGQFQFLLLDAYGVAVDTVRNRVYAIGISQGRIALIDGATDTIVGAIDVHRGDGSRVPLRVIAVNPGIGTSGHLWVVTSEEDSGQNQVLLIPVWPMGTPTPVPLDLPSFPLEGIALDPVANQVWVTSVRSGQVTVVQDGEPLCTTPFSAERIFRVRRLP
ncbi:MAG: PKD domain-containing protein [Thermoflexales bacterium]|nr:PKD domain-containing protein [Thermoflexales bacterium]